MIASALSRIQPRSSGPGPEPDGVSVLTDASGCRPLHYQRRHGDARPLRQCSADQGRKNFDCEDSISDRSLATRIPNALEQAARAAGIVEQKIDRTKSGERASRWRLVGRTRDGIAVTWEVELSRRGVPDARFVETRTIQPPYEYTIAPFVARVYGETAMAAAKVNALLSDNRSVPRDVFDLAELVRRGASPVPLWIEHLSRENLYRKRDAVLPKVTLIDFPLANAELLPYLARDIRATIDERR